MPQFFFVHFLPDDYQGYPLPHVNTQKIHIPTRDEVYEAWSDAGYNFYRMCGEEGEEYSMFLEHGDSAIYYASYMIITDKEMSPEGFERELSHFTEGLCYEVTPHLQSDFLSSMEEMPGVLAVIPIYEFDAILQDINKAVSK